MLPAAISHGLLEIDWSSHIGESPQVDDRR